MSDFFPSADALRARAAEAAAMRSDWLEQNRPVLEEFVSKTAAAGLTATAVYSRLNAVPSANLTTWEYALQRAQHTFFGHALWSVTCLSSELGLRPGTVPLLWYSGRYGTPHGEPSALAVVAPDKLHAELLLLAEYAS